MSDFKLPDDLKFNRGLVTDPKAFASDSASWLYLIGEEFASMPGGMTYAQVEEAVPHPARVISDPPRVLDLDLARRHVEELDRLPRPTAITCRTGPRASAVAYMYAGLRQGASFDDVIAAAEEDAAPFLTFPDYREWIRVCLEKLGEEA